jgi:hypothetical protein
MKLIGVWVLLFVLSFSALHDIFISTLDEQHPTISHDIIKSDQLSQYTPICEVHNLLHFIAILDFSQISFAISKNFTRLSEQVFPSTSPYIENSYKPPIA